MHAAAERFVGHLQVWFTIWINSQLERSLANPDWVKFTGPQGAGVIRPSSHVGGTARSQQPAAAVYSQRRVLSIAAMPRPRPRMQRVWAQEAEQAGSMHASLIPPSSFAALHESLDHHAASTYGNHEG